MLNSTMLLLAFRNILKPQIVNILYAGGRMTIVALLVLGLVQGLCEFLPVSSSGHLVLLSKVFGIEDSLFVSIILHVATLLAVVVVMRKEIWFLIKHPFSNQTISLALATISTCLVAVVLMPFITSSFEGAFLPVFFFLSAVILYFIGKKKSNKSGEVSYKRAIIIGLAQGFAIFPGLSRSGTTISAGLMSGAGREESSKFSFLVSLPIIVGSLLMEVYKISIGGQKISINIVGMILAFILAFAVGVASIKFMLKITNNVAFKWFSMYLIVLAIISAVIMW